MLSQGTHNIFLVYRLCTEKTTQTKTFKEKTKQQKLNKTQNYYTASELLKTNTQKNKGAFSRNTKQNDTVTRVSLSADII